MKQRAPSPLLVEILLFVCTFALFFACGNLEASWDVLERSYVLAHWDQAPASHRYFRTHVLELAPARAFAALLAGPSNPTAGLRGSSSACVALVAVATFRWARADERGSAFALAIVGLQLSAFSVWKLGSGGEEKMLAAAAAILAVGTHAWLRARGPTPTRATLAALVVGGTFGLAVLVHIANAVLGVGLIAAILACAVPGTTSDRRAALRELVFAATTAAVVIVLGYALLASLWFPDHPEPGAAVFEAVLRYHQAPAPSPSGASGRAALWQGWAATVTPGPSGGLVFVVVLVAAAACTVSVVRRKPEQRLTVALAAAAVAAWIVHFLRFEPWNSESWLALWLAATTAIAVGVPSHRSKLASIAAALLAVLIVGLSWSGYAEHRQARGRAWAERMAELCTADAIVILEEGLQTRALRVYAPGLETVGLQELFGQVEPYLGRAPTSPAKVNAHVQQGEVVCISETTARRLAQGIRVDAKTAGTIAGERVLHLTAPLRPRSPN